VSENTNKLGFIGMGLMGSRMTTRLLAAGFDRMGMESLAR
jgi:3-hydroxyisobutyrate dehydrogenase-like beta-hydroxyacid dehydrogenase